MTVDDASASQRRAALWHALGIGPLWRARITGHATDQPQPGTSPVPPDPLAESPGVGAVHRRRAIAAMDWERLERSVSACTACPLCGSRTQTVFEAGDRGARWMLVGEAPGAEEDARGEPFVGQAGRLLDQMLAAVGIDRRATGARSVYIANVLKCRPPANRNPDPTEVAFCEPYLKRQVALVQPRLILVMGRFAAQSLLASEATIASLRGRVHEIVVEQQRVPVVVTYHPAYLLRSPGDKAKAWSDLCLARAQVERALP